MKANTLKLEGSDTLFNIVDILMLVIIGMSPIFVMKAYRLGYLHGQGREEPRRAIKPKKLSEEEKQILKNIEEINKYEG